MIKGKFNEEEMSIFKSLEAKKEPIQARMDELKLVVQNEGSTNKMVAVARAQILEVQKGLVPLSEVQASLASPISRDKYFPDMSKSQFREHAKKIAG